MLGTNLFFQNPLIVDQLYILSLDCPFSKCSACLRVELATVLEFKYYVKRHFKRTPSVNPLACITRHYTLGLFTKTWSFLSCTLYIQYTHWEQSRVCLLKKPCWLDSKFWQNLQFLKCLRISALFPFSLVVTHGLEEKT